MSRGTLKEEKETKDDAWTYSNLTPVDSPLGSMMSFNADYGFLEALVRGMRCGFLRDFEYKQLCQCKGPHMEEVKLALTDTDYGPVLQLISGNLTHYKILEAARNKWVSEFQFLRSCSQGALTTFLEYITYSYQISAISFVVTSLLNGSRAEKLYKKVHPLGESPHLKSVLLYEPNDGTGGGLFELYKTVLVDTPVAPYFERYFGSLTKSSDQRMSDFEKHMSEQEIKTVTKTLERLWLEDFYTFCKKLGGETAKVMCRLLEFEADRRVLVFTNDTFSTSSGPADRAERKQLFPTFGSLYPQSHSTDFERVNSVQQLDQFCQPFPEYADCMRKFQREPGLTLRNALRELEIKRLREAFDGQGHFACFYAFCKLKEIEVGNLRWILDMIFQQREAKTWNDQWVSIYK